WGSTLGGHAVVNGNRWCIWYISESHGASVFATFAISHSVGRACDWSCVTGRWGEGDLARFSHDDGADIWNRRGVTWLIGISIIRVFIHAQCIAVCILSLHDALPSYWGSTLGGHAVVNGNRWCIRYISESHGASVFATFAISH